MSHPSQPPTTMRCTPTIALLAIHLAIILLALAPAAHAQPSSQAVQVVISGGFSQLLVRASDENTATGTVLPTSEAGTVSGVHATPAIVAGFAIQYALLIEPSALCPDPTSCTPASIEPLALALEQTLNPGETLSIANLLSPHITPIAGRDDLRPQLLAAATGAASSAPIILSTLSPPAHTHLEVLTLTSATTASTLQLPSAPLIPVHILTPSAPDAAICARTMATGGSCTTAAFTDANALQTALQRIQSLFIVRLGCPTNAPTASVTTLTGELPAGVPFVIPLPSLVCEITAGAAGADRRPLYIGLSIGALLVLILILIALRRPRRTPVEPVVDFSIFPPNAQARSRQDLTPVDDQPPWLRRFDLDNERQALRSTPVDSRGEHLLAIGKDGSTQAWPVTPSAQCIAGTHPQATLRLPDGPATALVMQSDGLGQVRMVHVESGADVRVNGAPAAAGLTVNDGDEISVGHHSLIEHRVPCTERAQSLCPSTPDAFDMLGIQTRSTIIGRDPLPYFGITPVPCKLAIPNISSDHLELWLSGGRAFVRDLGSSNGTWVGAQKIPALRPILIRPGMTVELASLVRFQVE